METLEEVNHTTRNEYGLKAGGLLAALDKFQTLFGLKLGHLIFGASETLSKSLQGKKYLSTGGSIAAVNLAKSFYRRHRTDDWLDHFYSGELLQGLMKAANHIAIRVPKIITAINTLKLSIYF